MSKRQFLFCIKNKTFLDSSERILCDKSCLKFEGYSLTDNSRVVVRECGPTDQNKCDKWVKLIGLHLHWRRLQQQSMRRLQVIALCSAQQQAQNLFLVIILPKVTLTSSYLCLAAAIDFDIFLTSFETYGIQFSWGKVAMYSNQWPVL